MGATGVAVGFGPAHDVTLRRTGAAVGFGILVTGLLLTPYLPFGVRSREAHLTLNALDTFVALLVAFLLHGRFVRSARLQDLLLAQGVALLGVAGLGLTYVGAVVPGAAPGTLEAWLPLAVRVLGALLVAGAAVAGERCVAVARRHRYPFVPPVVAVVVLFGLLLALRHELPVAVPLVEPENGVRPIVTGHPLLLASQAFSAGCFLLAAVAFTVRGTRHHDELLRWVGPAFVLAVFARVNYLLFPSLYTDWLYTGDVLRTGSYLLLLVGAAREIREYWQAQGQVAVLEDRRRLARELHDGVIQELGYIKAETRLLPASEAQTRIVTACDRALDEARSAVHVLGSDPDEPFARTLARAVAQVAERYAVDLALDLDDRVQVTPEQRHALVRIAREAVSNAARHGKASEVAVELPSVGEGGVVTISDDGRGFDVEEAEARGTTYGLTSMRDRANGLPGELRLQSSPGRGPSWR